MSSIKVCFFNHLLNDIVAKRYFLKKFIKKNIDTALTTTKFLLRRVREPKREKCVRKLCQRVRVDHGGSELGKVDCT